MIQPNSTRYGVLYHESLPALGIASHFQIQVIVSLTIQNIISLCVLNSIFDYLFEFQSHKVIKTVPFRCLPLVLRNKTWQKYVRREIPMASTLFTLFFPFPLQSCHEFGIWCLLLLCIILYFYCICYMSVNKHVLILIDIILKIITCNLLF